MAFGDWACSAGSKRLRDVTPLSSLKRRDLLRHDRRRVSLSPGFGCDSGATQAEGAASGRLSLGLRGAPAGVSDPHARVLSESDPRAERRRLHDGGVAPGRRSSAPRRSGPDNEGQSPPPDGATAEIDQHQRRDVGRLICGEAARGRGRLLDRHDGRKTALGDPPEYPLSAQDRLNATTAETTSSSG